MKFANSIIMGIVATTISATANAGAVSVTFTDVNFSRQEQVIGRQLPSVSGVVPNGKFAIAILPSNSSGLACLNLSVTAAQQDRQLRVVGLGTSRIVGTACGKVPETISGSRTLQYLVKCGEYRQVDFSSISSCAILP